ncbi:DNA adenine methylase [Paenibacillus koleovorans]|uniref:DNA adenine methylase n=1 Tax=Paenibacillus koleovorans TaxID=121608 RepID=UPI000FDBE34D|nr:DNA adenine methylase [Paenibacillus koleovorans]
MAVPRILHYPGSKWSIAKWIIEHMPEHRVYQEPYFGSGAVLFNKVPSPVETINDINGEVVNLFRIVRERPDELAYRIRWTPYAREEYQLSHEPTTNELERARRFMVRCWQAIRPKTNSISGWRCRFTQRDAFHIKQWNALPERMEIVADRLRHVQIENVRAELLIERYRDPDVLIFADPPYLLDTRNGAIYENELTDEQHMEMLDLLDKHPGPVLLTGYAHPLYDERLKYWHRRTTMGKPVNGEARTEVLWLNSIAANQIGQQVMQI